ncbi:MAG TPA: hypothetical protein VFF06_36950 [Polyangia bacterium]|nr:hypothetical protein [Polyangia bacterium]
MAYRDESVAARARLAALERDLFERREAPPALYRYRRALRGERARLRHALLWYRNGERFGHFYRIDQRDDLSPSVEPRLSAPGVAALERALAGRDALELRERERHVTCALAALEPRLWRAREEIGTLRAECDGLRAEVERYAEKFPAHPPPPEWNPLWARVLIGTVVSLAVVIVSWVVALIALAIAARS